MRILDVATSHGPARAHVHPLGEPRAVLVLGHGAGGGVAAPDLVAVTRAALAEGIGVVLVEQPYRVAGRRSAAPARHLDAAWVEVVERLRADELAALPLVVGGRSSGARVACRTAAEVGAIGVLCLAFPLHPPRRSGAPAPSRLSELEAVQVPTLVVQGERDPFGVPPAGPLRTVAVVPGDHGLKADVEAVAAAAGRWLAALVGGATAPVDAEGRAAGRRCECGAADCTAELRLTWEEQDSVDHDPRNLWLVAPGHELQGARRSEVVARTDRFAVVEAVELHE